MAKHTREELTLWQSLPLEVKIRMTEERIKGWINHFGQEGVYVSFSGGKDSTVLLDIVRNRLRYTKVPAVFVDTGLEYPEIRDFVKTFENVVWLKPEMNFKQVIERYGYPFISKDVAQCLHDVNVQSERRKCDKRETPMWNRAFNRNSDYCLRYPSFTRARYDFMNDAPWKFSHRCCDIMKKKPSKKYEKETDRKPILGTMASESRLRETQWFADGCNAFDVKRPTSKPMSFWTEQDVLEYIKKYHIQICSVYGDVIEDNSGNDNIDGQMRFDDLSPEFWSDEMQQPKLKTSGCERTGCMFCGFGCQTTNNNQFVRMKKTHPYQYQWIMKPWSEGGLNYKEVIDWINEHGNMNIKY